MNTIILLLYYDINGSYLDLVSHQDDGLSTKFSLDAFLKDVFPHVGIHGRQRVIQEEDVSIRVHRSGQADPLFLPPRDVNTSLSNLPITKNIMHS